MANASSMLGTKIVLVPYCATDADGSSGTRLDSACSGAGVNTVDFCSTEAEECFDLDRILL